MFLDLINWYWKVVYLYLLNIDCIIGFLIIYSEDSTIYE